MERAYTRLTCILTPPLKPAVDEEKSVCQSVLAAAAAVTNQGRKVNLDYIQFPLHCSKSPLHSPVFAAILQFLISRGWSWPKLGLSPPLGLASISDNELTLRIAFSGARTPLFSPSPPPASPWARFSSFQIFLQLNPESCMTTVFTLFMLSLEMTSGDDICAQKEM